MAVKFFARFNLHNSICQNPLSVRFLRPFFDMSDGDIEAMIREINEIQNTRAQRLIKKFPSQVKQLRGKKVLFLGDSITSDNLGYRESVTRAAGLTATDGSVSGGTSTLILHDAKMLTEKQRPDIVSVMIGSNDSVSIERKELTQVSIGEYERNVREIVRRAKESGAKVLLFEIPPVAEERFGKSFAGQSKMQSNSNISKYNRVLKRIADDNGIKLHSNSWLSGNDTFYEPDGIHLSVLGQELFAEKWLEAAVK